MSNFLRTGEYLTTDQCLASTNGAFFVRMENDGKLVLRLGTPDKPDRRIWSSSSLGVTGDYWVSMQADGNLVVYQGPRSDCSPYVWGTADKSRPLGEYHVKLLPDGSLIVCAGTPENPGEQIWAAASNPIFVLSALYGAPGAQPADVTSKTQEIFDSQYVLDNNRQTFTLKNISPDLFGIPDPASGQSKTFTIVYSLAAPRAGSVFMRGAQDFDTLTLTARSSRYIGVMKAVYAGNSGGVDVTGALNRYFRDPDNGAVLTIGSPRFMDALLEGGGYDPAPGKKKYFSATYITSPGSTTMKRVCGCDNQTVSLS